MENLYSHITEFPEKSSRTETPISPGDSQPLSAKG
jgi:hypothetical protein